MPVQKKKFIAQSVAGEKFWGFYVCWRPRSNLVIDVNLHCSFEIRLNIAVLIAELLIFDFYSLIFIYS